MFEKSKQNVQKAKDAANKTRDAGRKVRDSPKSAKEAADKRLGRSSVCEAPGCKNHCRDGYNTCRKKICQQIVAQQYAKG